ALPLAGAARKIRVMACSQIPTRCAGAWLSLLERREVLDAASLAPWAKPAPPSSVRAVPRARHGLSPPRAETIEETRRASLCVATGSHGRARNAEVGGAGSAPMGLEEVERQIKKQAARRPCRSSHHPHGGCRSIYKCPVR